MSNLVPELNPQPEPPSPALAIVTTAAGQGTATFQVVTHAGVIEIDFKTGHVTMKIPEKFPPSGVGH